MDNLFFLFQLYGNATVRLKHQLGYYFVSYHMKKSEQPDMRAY